MVYLILTIFLVTANTEGGVSVTTQKIGPYSTLEKCEKRAKKLEIPRVDSRPNYNWRTADCVPVE